MLPDRVSTPGPLTYESGALPTALRGPACWHAAYRVYLLALQQHVYSCGAGSYNSVRFLTGMGCLFRKRGDLQNGDNILYMRCHCLLS